MSQLLTAAFGYSLITALLFRNFLPVATTDLYSDLGDPLLNCAILQWNATHVPLSGAWWNFPAFAPLSGVTAFTEHLIGAYPITSPIIWITGNAVLAYNVLLLLCFPLNGLATFALVRELTGSAFAAFVAGLAFAFAPYHAEHMSHVQMLMAFGMPLALFGLHRYLRTGRTSALAWFACGWLSALLSNAYTLVFFPILATLWSIWFFKRADARRWLGIAAVAILTTVPVVPLLHGYQARQTAYGFVRGYSEIKAMSADVAGLFGISHRSVLWEGWLPGTLYESSLFPGVAILVLVVIAVGAGLREKLPSSRWPSRLIRLAAACLWIVLVRIWAGPFGWHFGPVRFPPFEPYRVGPLVLALLIVGVSMTGRVRSAWFRRDPALFYVVAAIGLWLLALGPEPMWSGARALRYGPYWLLLQLPGAQSIRVPARAWLPAAMCLAVCAGLGASRLTTSRWGKGVLAALALGIVAEGWFFDGSMAAPVSMLKGVIPAGAVVLDLPITEAAGNADPQYLAVLGSYRVVNGYSGYTPPHFDRLRHALGDHRAEAFAGFRQLSDLDVIVRPGVDQQFIDWLETQVGIEHLLDSSGWKLYRLPRASSEPLPSMPLPLPRPGRVAFSIR